MNVRPLRLRQYCSKTADMIYNNVERVGDHRDELLELTNGQINVDTTCIWKVHLPLTALSVEPMTIFIWEVQQKRNDQFFTVVNGKVFSHPNFSDLVDMITTELLESGIAIPQ